MKKIIRLSENDLSKIIKKILKEQNQTNYNDNSVRIAKMFHKTVSGAGTDENGLYKAIKAIQTSQQFNEVNQIVKTLKGNMSIPQWINDELGEDDKFLWKFITKHLNSIDVPCRACVTIRGGINKIPAALGNFTSKSFSLGHPPCPAGTWIWKNDDSWSEALGNPYFAHYQDSKNIKDGKFIPPPAGSAGNVRSNWKPSNKINLQTAIQTLNSKWKGKSFKWNGKTVRVDGFNIFKNPEKKGMVDFYFPIDMETSIDGAGNGWVFSCKSKTFLNFGNQKGSTTGTSIEKDVAPLVCHY